VGLRSSVEAVEWRKMYFPFWESNPSHPVCSYNCLNSNEVVEKIWKLEGETTRTTRSSYTENETFVLLRRKVLLNTGRNFVFVFVLCSPPYSSSHLRSQSLETFRIQRFAAVKIHIVVCLSSEASVQTN
jgi:hypothetical protein